MSCRRTFGRATSRRRSLPATPRPAVLATGVVVGVVMSVATLAPAAPIPWPVAEGGNGSFYEFVPINPLRPLSWEQARSAAAGRSHQGLPGHLATITSAAEQAFVGSISNPPALPGYYFLGGVQAEGASGRSEGWSWVTGEPWQFTAWAADRGEPNDMTPLGLPSDVEQGNEQHLTFSTFPGNIAANWNDLDGRQPTPVAAGYVVEYAVPEPSAARLIAAGAAVPCLRRRVRQAK